MPPPADAQASAGVFLPSPMPHRLCVFCASSTQLAPAHQTAAMELGALIGRHGDELVYGGSDAGMMGQLAVATRTHGGRVHGVITHALDAAGYGTSHAHELVVAADLRTRKGAMMARADAFVVLPGGIGTLDECIEVLAHKLLGEHGKPLVIVNTAGFYDPLLALLSHLHAHGAVADHGLTLYTVVPAVAAVYPALGWGR